MKITASIDLIEGELAVLMVGEKKFQLPRIFLPEGVKPGGWVDITIEENKEKEITVRNNVSDLLDQLKKGEHLK